MTDYLGGAALAVGIVLIGAAYILFGQLQLLKTWVEQMAAALGVKVAAVPSKSAPRTDGSAEKPRRWWTKLIVEAEDAPSEKPRPTPGPRTEPDGLPANDGLKAARLTAAQEIDPEFADMLAEHERQWQESKARVDVEMAAERREQRKGAK